MKNVYLLIKDDCDNYDGCITEVIGVFRFKTMAKLHRKNIVKAEFDLQGDNMQGKEKSDNYVRLNIISGSITFIIEKKELQ